MERRKQQMNPVITFILFQDYNKLFFSSSSRKFRKNCLLSLIECYCLQFQRQMFKNTEKRFQYNINPHLPDEMERYSNKYPTNMRAQQYPLNATSPINKRGSINYSLMEDRQRNNLSIHETSYQAMPRNDERTEGRGRTNSAVNMKRNSDRPASMQRNKITQPQEARQAKKVYFGGDPYPQYDTNNQKYEKPRPTNARGDENRRFNGQDVNAYLLQENNNYSNLKHDNFAKDAKPSRKNDAKHVEAIDYGVNQKQIIDKIGRINRLNEQIKNRLQRMLNKIDCA